jgi:hypothetical protein
MLDRQLSLQDIVLLTRLLIEGVGGMGAEVSVLDLKRADADHALHQPRQSQHVRLVLDFSSGIADTHRWADPMGTYNELARFRASYLRKLPMAIHELQNRT